MRTFVCCLVVFVVAQGLSFAKDESVDDLKASLETLALQDRPKLCIRIAQHQLRNANRLYTDGNVEQARLAVQDIITYSEKARDTAKESKKHLKHVEIAVRKMADKLNDIKRTLAFEDQPSIDQAIQHLQDVRTDLLQEMFKKEKK